MSEHIFIEKTNRARIVRDSPHDRGTLNILPTIIVLSSAHDFAHASISGHLNIRWTFCEQQRELKLKYSELGKGGGKTF